MDSSARIEAERLAARRDPEPLDSAPEPVLDGLTEAAALVCGAPMSLLSLVDDEHRRFEADVGLDHVPATLREHAFRTIEIEHEGLLEVPDATLDERFADDPMVIGEPGIRFYAGVPLRAADGSRTGTLCVVDRVARELTPVQRSTLERLAAAAAHTLEARRVATALEASEARFRALSEAASLGIFETDRTGVCTSTNARWRAIFGSAGAASDKGRRWSEAVHPDERVGVVLDWQRSVELALDFDREFRVRREDGVVRHVRMLSRPILDDGVVVAQVGSVEDISERKAQELALRRSEKMLEAAGSLADVGSWELDLKEGILTWSDRTCRVHGVEPGYRPTLHEAIDYYAPEARQTVRDALRSSIVDGQGWDLELPFVRKGGEKRWVRALGRADFEDGKPVRVLGAFQDITRRVAERQALERAHERMMLATESGRIGIWDWDIASGTADWTPQMYPLLGMPPGPERVAGEAWMARVHHGDRDALRESVRRALASGEPLDTEFRVLRENGGIGHLCVAARTTRGADGREAIRMQGAIWDVTPLRDLSDELTAQHELLRVTLQSIADAVVTVDADARVTWLNPAAERLTGWRSDEAVGLTVSDVCPLVDEETLQADPDPVRACLRGDAEPCSSGRSLLVSRTGERLGVENSAAPIRSAGGELLGAVFVCRDVSEQRRLSREMSYRASHDALTGLVNRAELETRLERTLSRAREHGAAHALIYIDLDRFKLVNDTCGHSIGDRLLQQVAKLMASAMRLEDTLARTGGDEFAALLEDCSSEHAERVAREICKRLDDFRFVHDGQRFHIGASIGLVPIDGRWTDIAAPMKAADLSCYAAKRAGRNRVHRWLDADAGLTEHGREAAWVARLEQALDDDRFVLFAQRIDPASGRTEALHAELLIRLRDDDDRLIGPDAFLPAAERFHLATRIDRWVLREAIGRLGSLAVSSAATTLCVNVSGQSVGDAEFHRDAIDALTRAGEDVCRRLCLEITETAAITNMNDAVAFAEKVRLLGVRIALDDFGAGASSFDYLRRLPADVLKIDGRYIRNMIDDPLDDAAVRCFVDVARVTGVRTVAEYVDRPEVLARVREIGIDHVQGFLLHEPEPLDDLLAASRGAAIDRSVA